MAAAARRPWGALAGIAAPASFITGWVIGGSQTRGYSPVRDHISDLAAVGAQTRPLMTAGFLGFSAFAPVFARSIAGVLEEPKLAVSITAAAVGTLGVAAFPLGGPLGTGPHAAAAAASYVAMASTPILGGRALSRAGSSALGRASVVTGAVSGGLLVASLVGDRQGLFQRAGLTVVDAWFIAMAVRELRARG